MGAGNRAILELRLPNQQAGYHPSKSRKHDCRKSPNPYLSILEYNKIPIDLLAFRATLKKMKKSFNLMLFLIAATISIQPEVQARAVAKNSWMDGQILVIDFNGKQMRFLGWTDDAKYYWEHGSMPPAPASSNQSQINEIIDAVNRNSSSLRYHDKIIKQQASEVLILRDTVEQLEQELASLRSAARIAVWTDTEGKSFAGEFIEYDLAAVKIKKTSDGIVYTVPFSKLDSDSQKLAFALDSK